MSQISYSTLGFLDRGVESALDAIAEAGFDQAEILGQDPHLASVPRDRALTEFTARLATRGLAGGTVHAPLSRNVLGAPEEGWRREKVEVLADYIRFAAAIGASDIIIHPVPNPCFVPDADHPEMPQRISDAVSRSLDDLVPIAREAGIHMLLENLPYHCPYPFLTMMELRPLVDEYPEEVVGLVIDTGHAWTTHHDPAAEIRAAGHRLGGVHLQDVDYGNPQDDHWVPTHGGLDWDAIRNAFAEIRYAGPWTFEVAHARQGESAEELASMTRGVAVSWGL
jgi:L-ribulose-5-phosphate 3-epimerase